jgi:uncharacterized protein (DUF2141 family)
MKKIRFILFSIIVAFSVMGLSCSEEEDAPVDPPTTGTISGVITEQTTGIALESASVFTEPATSLVTTDANGAYRITTVEPGDYSVTAVKNGYDTMSVAVTVTAGAETIADFIMEKTDSTGSRYFGDLQGVVRNSQNGLPIPKVNIFTVPASQSVTTDDIGQYKIENIAIGEYVVTAEKAGYDTVNISVVIQAGQITEADFFLTEVDTSTPPTTGMIEGTVRDAQTGASISGAVLSTDPTTDVVTSSGDGSYSFENITPGEYTISIAKTGYQNASISVTVTAGKTSRADIVLIQSYGSISGIVKDATTELPIQGVNIQTDPATSSVTTDSDGRYKISGITPGSFTVKASKAGYADAEIPVVVTAGNETAADIPMQPGK